MTTITITYNGTPHEVELVPQPDGTSHAIVSDPTLAAAIRGSDTSPITLNTLLNFIGDNQITVGHVSEDGFAKYGYLTDKHTSVTFGNLATKELPVLSTLGALPSIEGIVTNVPNKEQQPVPFGKLVDGTYQPITFYYDGINLNYYYFFDSSDALYVFGDVGLVGVEVTVTYGNGDKEVTRNMTFQASNEPNVGGDVALLILNDEAVAGIEAGQYLPFKIVRTRQKRTEIFFDDRAFEMVGRTIKVDWGNSSDKGVVAINSDNIPVFKAESGLDELGDFLSSAAQDAPIDIAISVEGDSIYTPDTKYAFPYDKSGNTIISDSTDSDSDSNISPTDAQYIRFSTKEPNNFVIKTANDMKRPKYLKTVLSNVSIPLEAHDLGEIAVANYLDSNEGRLLLSTEVANKLKAAKGAVTFNYGYVDESDHTFSPTVTGDDVIWRNEDKGGDVNFVTDIIPVQDKFTGTVVPEHTWLEFKQYVTPQGAVALTGVSLGNGVTLTHLYFKAGTEEVQVRMFGLSAGTNVFTIAFDDGDEVISGSCNPTGNGVDAVLSNWGPIGKYLKANQGNYIKFRAKLVNNNTPFVTPAQRLSIVDSIVGNKVSKEAHLYFNETAVATIGMVVKFGTRILLDNGKTEWVEQDLTVINHNSKPCIDLTTSTAVPGSSQKFSDAFLTKSDSVPFIFEIDFADDQAAVDDIFIKATTVDGKTVVDNSLDDSTMLAAKDDSVVGNITRIEVADGVDEVVFTIGTTDKEA